MEKHYHVVYTDGLGYVTFEDKLSSSEVREFCSRNDEQFNPEGGGFDYDFYNAGSDSRPSWRSSGFSYEPLE